jgi:fatty acid desaturase
MSTPSADAPQFSLAQARGIVADLFKPQLRIYWIDFLTTIILGHAAGATILSLHEFQFQPLWLRLVIQCLLFPVQCVCYYRAVMFIHEIVHLPEKDVRVFERVWNLLCGIPFLVPVFTYHTHLDHHRRRMFGTKDDGEYLPLASMSPWYIVVYFSQCLWVPPLALVRFGILTPLSWICPPLRRFIHQRASSLVIDPAYIRPLPTPQQLRSIRIQELLCFLFLAWMLVGRPLFRGFTPLPFLVHAYCSAIVIVSLNALRTIAAHRFWSDGRESTFVEQMLDSVTMDNDSALAMMINPVGLRYHATHHLFPSLPYHNLRTAHKRLMAQLPADSPYRRTVERSVWAVLFDLVRRAREFRGTGLATRPVVNAPDELQAAET